MPSFGDTALIALIALLLFGPKKLPELARQLGKLMGEFRRASNEFRMQMEDELRLSEQEDQRKKIAAMEAAAPIAPPLLESAPVYQDESIVIDHPHQPAFSPTENTIASPTDALAEAQKPDRTPPQETPEPLPIATAGDLSMMPPSTGLPVSRSALSTVFDAIPKTEDPEHAAPPPPPSSTHEASLHG